MTGESPVAVFDGTANPVSAALADAVAEEIESTRDVVCTGTVVPSRGEFCIVDGAVTGEDWPPAFVLGVPPPPPQDDSNAVTLTAMRSVRNEALWRISAPTL